MKENNLPTKREERIVLWSDLVKDVAKAGYLPVDTKRELIDLCLDMYDENGYRETYGETPFFLSHTYADRNWKVIINAAADGRNGIFIKFVRGRDDNSIGFKGQWQIVHKRDYYKVMMAEARGLETRIENFQYSSETAKKRWKGLQLPMFEVKQITGGSD